MASEFFLEERHIVEFMMYFQDRLDVKASDFQSITSNWDTIGKILNKLVENGILSESRDERRKRVILYNLTSKGKTVVRLLDTAECIIHGDADLDDLKLIEMIDGDDKVIRR